MSNLHLQKSPGTLGHVLFASSPECVLEREWVAIVESIAAGDAVALHSLYDRTHHLVFTLGMRIVARREKAEEITLDVFQDVWDHAATYDPVNGTVLSWVMNLARWRALKNHPTLTQCAERSSAEIELPSRSLAERLAHRIAQHTGKPPASPRTSDWREPAWDNVAPGIQCKVLTVDAERDRVSVLVRLASGAAYPAHKHADIEELHLLDGALWIDGRRLFPGAYNYASPGSVDFRVWSETGCTCVLTTSSNDVLR